MQRKVLKVSFLSLTIILAIYFTLVVNLPILLHFYRILTSLDNYKLGFALSIPLVLIAALNFVFTPFTFKPIFKPFFCIVLVISAFASYAQLKYKIIFDRSMIENIFETNSAEASSYYNFSVVLWVLFTGILPCILLMKTQIIYAHGIIARLGLRLVSMLVSLLIIALVASLYYQDYASVGRNNRTLNLEILPTNYLYSASQYINRRYLTKPIPFRKIGDDAKLVQKIGSKPTLVFLIVGETARNQNQQLQGYPRPTNPYTSQEPDLIYFSKVSSCGTATAVSVPCMFSNMPRTHFDNNIARNSEGLMDILQKAGVSTYWKDNDEGCKGACDRIPTQIVPTNSDKNLCDGDTCYDAVLLNDLDKLIPNDGKNKTLAFHLIGSHGPTYYKRYPKEFRFFMPDCQRSDIENCTQQQLVNTYDNTIRYTDYVVSQFIQRLKGYEKDYNVALYYVSDHGESLGEDGLYLHGTPYKFAPKEQTRVPMEMWLSDSYVKAQGIDRACVASLAKNNEFSHDNLFHTMLSMMNVQTKEYNPSLDILKTCRTQNP